MKAGRNQWLNVVEAVAAFLVVFIHFPFPGSIGHIVIAIARIAVPFFFSVSGFFFFKGEANAELVSVLRKVKRLFGLIIFSEMTYFLFYVLLQIINIGITFQAVVNVIEAELLNLYVRELAARLCIFAPPFNGICWFIGSLIAVYGVIYFVVKFRWWRQALWLSVGLLAVGIMLRRILFHIGIDTTFPYERLLPFLPFPFFVLGYYIRKNFALFDRIKDSTYYIAIIGGIVLTIAESFGGVHTLYIGTLILVISIISLCGKHDKQMVSSLPGRVLNHIGGQTATYIYLFHMLIGNIVGVIISKTLPSAEKDSLIHWAFPVLVCVASAICGEGICMFKRVVFTRR